MHPNCWMRILRDGFAYVQRELVGSNFPDETLAEVARIGAANFLVLKLLCQHLRQVCCRVSYSGSANWRPMTARTSLGSFARSSGSV